MTALAETLPIPAGPHEFVAEIAIDCPPCEVYPLIDLADPRHTQRHLGDSLEAIPGHPDRFELVLSDLPDVVLTLQTTLADSPHAYAFNTEASVRFGRVLYLHEHHALHPAGANGCRLVLTQTVTFDGPIDEEGFALESMMLSLAGARSLAKIKLHAEDGIEAVRALTEG